MTILVFGKSGQVAQELSKLPDVMCFGRAQADFLKPSECRDLLTSIQPKAVINAAAYTAVDQAESEPEIAEVINGETPGVLAQYCAGANIPLVHISTDYVFSGECSKAWHPSDPTAPLGVYGASKLAGEQAVIAAAGPHAILRTSWVFSAHGGNFVKTMLRLGQSRSELNVVSDQIGGPTSAASIAAACHKMALQLCDRPEKSGIYHFSGSPDCSWAEFAKMIFKAAGINCIVTEIPTEAYPTPAARPKNSRLDCGLTQEVFGIERPDWRIDLSNVLKDLGEIA